MKHVTKQLWECPCGHGFYTELDEKVPWYRRFGKRKRIKCTACGNKTAVKKKRVKLQVLK